MSMRRLKPDEKRELSAGLHEIAENALGQTFNKTESQALAFFETWTGRLYQARIDC